MIDPANHNLKPGIRVTYSLTREPGVVKGIQGDVAFVVYQCGGDWENYREYTGAYTNIWDLELGWKMPEDEGRPGTDLGASITQKVSRFMLEDIFEEEEIFNKNKDDIL